MAIAAQPSGSDHPSPASWPAPEELEAFAPTLRLLSAIGAVPHVTKIGATVTQTGVDLWVFMAAEDYEAEALITRAEVAYLNATRMLGFALHVIPGTDVSPEVLPPYTVLFER
jgi:hypothetical protein